MRTLPTYGVLSSDLCWWESLINTSQCWGNRLKMCFWESLEGTLSPTKHGVLPCAHVRSLGSANCLVDDKKETRSISRVKKTIHIASVEHVQGLIWAVSNVFRFSHTGLQAAPMKAGIYSPTSTSSIVSDIYSGSGSRNGVWMSWDGMSAGHSSGGTGASALECCFENTQEEGGETENDRMQPFFPPFSHEEDQREGHHAFAWTADKGLKQCTNLSWSARGLKDVRQCGPLFSSSRSRRAMSTSTEKQCDEELGEQQSPIMQQSSVGLQTPSHQQSSGQQQSSLEIPDSKPQGGPSWPNPDNAASYVLMSNIYADGNRWDEVKRINEMRLKARAWKKPGKAYVEIKAKVHEFIVGDRTHQESVNIYEKLRKIKRHMGHIGYVPNVDLILENRSYYDPYKPR